MHKGAFEQENGKDLGQWPQGDRGTSGPCELLGKKKAIGQKSDQIKPLSKATGISHSMYSTTERKWPIDIKPST